MVPGERSGMHRVPRIFRGILFPCPLRAVWPSLRYSHIPALCLLLSLSGFSQTATPSAQADWPDWRGPMRTGVSLDPLPPTLPDDPTPLFEIPANPGYAAPVVAQGRLIWLEDRENRETVVCHDATTGKHLWSRSFAAAWGDEFEPGPRCTPVVDGDRVYVQSNQGEFACLKLNSGDVLWNFSFRDYGMVWISERGSGIGAATRRGHTGSPVLDGDRIIVQVGSENRASLVAFDKISGKELWRSQSDLAAYTSPMVGTLAGIRQVVTATCEGLLGVAVEDGALLWRVPFKTQANRNVLTPILHQETVTFASFTTGMQCRRIVPASDARAEGNTPQIAETVWHNRRLGINLSTPVRVEGYLYGLGANKDFVCVNAATGDITWSETGFNDVASTIGSGNRLLVLLDTGECRLLEANPEAYTERGRFQASGRTFSHPAYARGVLYVRDPTRIRAYALLEK